MAEDAVTRNETSGERRPAPRGDRPERAERGERNADDRGERGGDDRRPARRPRVVRRRKFCKFCADVSIQIDHKNPDLLKQFITERYKILPSRVTGTCAKHQRAITTSIKRARDLAMLPFTPLHHD